MSEHDQNIRRKVPYEAPIVEVIRFSTEDMITTSGLQNDGLGEGDEFDWNIYIQ